MAKKTPSAALSDVQNVVVGAKATAKSTFQPGAPVSDAVPAKAVTSKNLKKKILDEAEESAELQAAAEAQADVVLAQLTTAPAAAAAAPAAPAAAAATAAEVATVVAPTQVGASVAVLAGGFSPLTLAAAGLGLAAAGGGGGGGGSSAPVPTYTATRNVDVVTETGTIAYTLTTQYVAAGTELRYEITGVSRSDLAANTLTGTVVVDANGRATLNVAMRADRLTEAQSEGVTVTFYRGDVIVATASRVSVIDTSLGSIALTTNADTPGNTGTEGDDWIVGESTPLTYNAADIIDGDSGNDVLELNLTAQSATYGSAFVTSVETLIINAFDTSGQDTVTLSLSRFDDQLVNIEINQAAAHVVLQDLQNVAAVSILDTSKTITLNYDVNEPAVSGVGTVLEVTVSEFGQGEANPGTLNISAGIETLVLNVADLEGKDSAFYLNAPSVTLVTIVGGLVGQDFGIAATIAAGAEVNATAFQGNFHLDSTNALNVLRTSSGNDSAYVAGMTGEDSVFNLGEGDNELYVDSAIAGDVVAGSGIDLVATSVGVTATGSVNLGAGNNRFTSAGAVNGSVTVGGNDDIINITSGDVGATSVITLGAGVNSLTVAGSLAGDVTAQGGIDTLIAAGIADTSSVNLAGGNNVITSSAAIAGDIITTDGNDTVTTVGVTADGSLDLGAGNNVVTSSAAVAGDITTTGGDDIITVSVGGVADGSDILMGDGANSLTVTGASIAGDVTGGAGVDTVTSAGIDATGSLSLGNGVNSVTSSAAVDGDITVGDNDDTIRVTAGGVGVDSVIALGAGANSLTVTGSTIAGAVTGLGGADTVTTAGIAATGSLDLGAGNNVITSSAAVAGDITTTGGNDIITVSAGGVADGSDILMGDGTNSLTVTGASIAGDVTGGANADTVTTAGIAVTGSLSLGNGANSVTSSAAVLGDITVGDNDDTIRVNAGGVGVDAVIALGAGTNSLTVTGNVAGNVAFGMGNDTLAVTGDIVGGTPLNVISMGEGDNTVTVSGSVIGNVDVTFGDGDGNSMAVGGDITDAPSTVSFGDGDNNSLSVGGSIIRSTVTMGDGDNISLTVGGGAYASNITLGDGSGSIVFGKLAGGTPTLDGSGAVTTKVDLGGGNDSVTINTTVNGPTSQVITSGASLIGGLGNDTLTINAFDDVTVIARTEQQVASVTVASELARGVVVSIDAGARTYTTAVKYTEQQVVAFTFGGDLVYTEGQRVELTVGTDTYFYIIPYVQGANAAEAVAAGLVLAMNDGGITAEYGFSVTRVGAVVTLTGSAVDADLNANNVTTAVSALVATKVDNAVGRNVSTEEMLALALKNEINFDGDRSFHAAAVGGVLTLTAIEIAPDIAADEIITAVNAVVAVVEVANASISGFETLNLVALDPQDGDSASDLLGANINANFDLIEGVDKINLTSQVELVPTLVNGVNIVNGAYTSNAAGDPVKYKLQNLRDDEVVITVSADEITATGNRYVSRVTVANGDGDHLLGDILIMTINGIECKLIVNENDLSGLTAQADAERIVSRLLAEYGATALAEGFDVRVDANVITFIGQPMGYQWSEERDAVTNYLTVNHFRASTDGPGWNVATEEAGAGWLIKNESTYAVGDIVTIALSADVNVRYTIKVTDLDGNCGRTAAENVALGLAAALSEELSRGGPAVVVEADRSLILFTSDVLSGPWLTRPIDDLVFNLIDPLVNERTVTNEVQQGIDPDDSVIDVTVSAFLSSDADTESDTLRLVVNGTGSFDMLLDDEGANDGQGYEAMSLNVADSYSHYIDTNLLAGDVITMTGAANADADIYLDNVDATTVNAGGVKANLTINQVYSDADAEVDANVTPSLNYLDGEGDISITTGSGDDTLITSADAALRDGSSINLGTGENTLSLLWNANELLHGQALSIKMSPQFDTVAATFDTEVGSIGDNIATAPTIAVGTKIEGNLQTSDDIDMFKVVLVAGETYQFSMFGEIYGEDTFGTDYSLYDPILTLRDANGVEIAFDDDEGHDLNSVILYKATTSGTYYLEAAAYDSDNSGTYAIEVVNRTADVLPALHPLQSLAGMDFTGNLHQLDIMTDVVLAEDSTTTLTMPGLAGQVDVLTLRNIELLARQDIYSVGVDAEDKDTDNDGAEASLTIVGTASTLEMVVTGAIGHVSMSDGDYSSSDDMTLVLEAVGVQDLTVIANAGDANLEVNGLALKKLLVGAMDSAELTLQGVKGGLHRDAVEAEAVANQLLALESVDVRAFLGASVDISLIRTGADVNIEVLGGPAVLDISYAELGDVMVTYGNSMNANAHAYADVSIDYTDDSKVSLGNLDVLSQGEDGWGGNWNGNWGSDVAEVSIDGNDNSEVTIGHIVVDVNSSASLGISDNDGSTVSINSLTLASQDSGFAAVTIDDNDDTSVTIVGAVNLSADFGATMNIINNDAVTTEASVVLGNVTVSSCGEDATVRIYNNADTAREFDMRVTLTSVTLDAGSDAVLEIIDNSDVTVNVGNVTVTAGTWDISDDLNDDSDSGINAEVDVSSNDASVINLGHVELTSYGYSAGSAVRIDGNSGDRPDNLVGETEITTRSLSIVAKGQEADAELHITGNEETSITVNGGVQLTSSDTAELYVADNAEDVAIVINGNVVLDSGGNAGVDIDSNQEIDSYDYLRLTLAAPITFDSSTDYLTFSLTIDQETYAVIIREGDVGGDFIINDNAELATILANKIASLVSAEAGRELASVTHVTEGANYVEIKSLITGDLSNVSITNLANNIAPTNFIQFVGSNNSLDDDMSFTINGDLTINAADQTLNNLDTGNASFDLQGNVDDTVTITGDLSLNGIDTGLFIGNDERNINLTFSAGAVSLTSQNLAGADHGDNNADVRVKSNEHLFLSMDSLSATADTRFALLELDDNDKSEIIITGDITIASGVQGGPTTDDGNGSASLDVRENTNSTVVLGVEYGDDGETIVERHLVSVSGNSDSYLEIGDNDLSFVDVGNVIVVSGNSDAEVQIKDHDNSHIRTGSMTITADDSRAWFNLDDNDFSQVLIDGDVTVTGNQSYADIDAHDGSTMVISGSVTTTSTGLFKSAYLDIDDNDDSLIAILGEDGLTVTSSDSTAYLDITDNDNSVVIIENDVTLTAGGSTRINIVNNDRSSLVVLGVDLVNEPATADQLATYSLGTILGQDVLSGELTPIMVGGLPTSLNQVTMTGDGDAEFGITGNDQGADVYVGHLTITSSDDSVDFDIFGNNAYGYWGPGSASDSASDDASNVFVGNVVIDADINVTVDIADGGRDTRIVVGNFTIDAGNDVLFHASNTSSDDDTSVTLGNSIVINAGLDESIDAYVELELDNVLGAKVITIDASTSAGSFVYADIVDSVDVETLTISSGTAEVYVSGDSDDFRTLDIKDVTEFAYVETWAADFRDLADPLNADDTVTVLIGNGNVQYNALYGADFGEDNESSTWYTDDIEGAPGYADSVVIHSDADWIGDAGWYSLGAGHDFTPVPQVQTITNFAEYSVDTDNDGRWGIFYNTMQFEQNDISYRVQVEMGRYEGDFEGNGDDTVYHTTDVNYYALLSNSWHEFDGESDFEEALGIGDFNYKRYEASIYGEFTLTGLADGTAFEAVRDAVQVTTSYLNAWSAGFSSIDNERPTNAGVQNDNIDLFNLNSAADRADDGRGNDVAEIFTFTGTDIGEIVIGGFFASPYAMETVDSNVRWADKLDFSQFTGGAVVGGRSTDLDSTTLDMTFTVDDGDGYFKDVIIDFTNEAYGSIRLVGAGEYNGTELELLNRVAQSVIFA